MPAIPPYSSTEVDEMEIDEIGVHDGSSGTENYEIDHNSATRTYRCAFDQRYNALAFLLGYSTLYVSGGVTMLSRLLPQPYNALLPNLIASKVSPMKGFQWNGSEDNGLTKTNTFTQAEFTILYENPPYELVTDGGITTEQDRYFEFPADTQPSGSVIQLPGNALFYAPPGPPPPPPPPGVPSTGPYGYPTQTGAAIVTPTETVYAVWHRLPEAAFEDTSNLYIRIYQGTFTAGVGDGIPYYGTINKTTFQGRPPGTLLFNSFKPMRRRSPFTDGYEWDLRYELVYKPQGHNFLYYFPPGGTGTGSGWYYVSKSRTYHAPGSVPDGDSLYNEREFANLFSVS